MREGGVPTYRTIEAATAALACDRPAARRGRRAADAGGRDRAARATTTSALATCWRRPACAFVDAVEVRGRDEAQVAAGQLGFPVVVKALGHAAQVRCGRRGGRHRRRRRARARWSPTWRSGWRRHRALARADGPAVRGVELIIGARRDSRFGPIALVGLGGVYAEVLEDVAIGLAPLDQAGAVALLESLRGAAILHGAARPAAGGYRRGGGGGGGAVTAGGGAPRHRRDRDQPAAGDAGRRAGTGRAHHPRGRIRTCWLRARFDGKVAIVTGGGSGMGRAMAREFARLGAAVVVAGRRPEPLAETVALIEAAGGRAIAQPTDVRDPEQVDAMVAAAVDAVRPRGRAGQRRRRQLRGQGRGSVAQRLARGHLDRAGRRLSVRPRGGPADDRAGRGRRDPERDRKLRLDRRPGHRAFGGRQGGAGGDDPDAGGRVGAARDPGQHDLPRPDGDRGRRRGAMADGRGRGPRRGHGAR